MNLMKHVNVSYRSAKSVSSELMSNFYVRHQPLSVMGTSDVYELVKRKKVIEDAGPISTAFFILSNAKLHVLQVSSNVNFILTYKHSLSTT